MKIGQITIKDNPNCGVSLYYSGVFCGMMTGGNEISIASNKDTIASEKLMVWILRKFHNLSTIYAYSWANHQQHFIRVSTKKMIVEQGVIREY